MPRAHFRGEQAHGIGGQMKLSAAFGRELPARKYTLADRASAGRSCCTRCCTRGSTASQIAPDQQDPAVPTLSIRKSHPPHKVCTPAGAAADPPPRGHALIGPFHSFGLRTGEP
eukprot:3154655-Prymnesium_polylepis.1